MARQDFSSTSRELARIGRRFYARGWVLGTSGNFSAVLQGPSLQLAITASAVNKGTLSPAQILRLDSSGRAVQKSSKRPSAEAQLHLEIVKRRRAGAVLHTHSIWATMLSDLHAPSGVVPLEGYEMLKGLDGVSTHEHRELVPILDNDQDMTRLAARLGAVLDEYPSAKAVLLRRHGLYTWGRTLGDAERHVEILEFLFETVGRIATLPSREVAHGAAQNS
jgi:methylthioribulose-1-phosphate dehydratase